MFELPPLDQLALGALIVGVLFSLRLLLAVRRIREEADGAAGFSFGDLSRVRRPGTYGDALEPNRRYAVRQLVTATVCLAAALLLFAWLLVSNVLGPFVARGLAI